MIAATRHQRLGLATGHLPCRPLRPDNQFCLTPLYGGGSRRGCEIRAFLTSWLVLPAKILLRHFAPGVECLHA